MYFLSGEVFLSGQQRIREPPWQTKESTIAYVNYYLEDVHLKEIISPTNKIESH